ncbi:DDE-domain-containing protein [Gyrodon lividus]|nr:DDE-domain-containing protein [Gyrodon lividus]
MLELKCKPRDKPTTDSAHPAKWPKATTNTPKTSAQPPITSSCTNLTLADWLSVYAYIDSHPGVKQASIVQHFHSLQKGALLFDQSTLSRKLRQQPKIQAHVERALVLWVKDMENKGETVTGLMLREKWRRFEDQFQIHEFRRHGEAASVDQDAVEAKRIQCQQLVAKFALRDRFNKLEPFFIRKAAKPRCFKQRTPEQRGFYYWNNKHAWMTGALFEEWIKQLDIKMKHVNQHILLLMDNFSGHMISYQPSHIQMEYFELHMTPFVQPCDAGIIWCFKALYHCFFNQRALDRDEAGESEIYKIDLLEAMSMAKAAWDKLEEVEAQLMETVDTLKSCNCIFGTPPTLLELLDPPEEKEIRQGPLLEANQSDEAIMDAVHQEMAASKHDVIEVESDDEEDPADPPVTRANVMLMSKEYGDVEEVLALSHHLHQFCAKLRRQEFLDAKQTLLDSFFGL